jgi:hypothetical protein
MPISNYGYAAERAGRAGNIRNEAHCKRVTLSAPPGVAEVRTLTIGSVSNSTTYTEVIDGQTLSYTTPGSGNTTSTRAEQVYQAAIANLTLAGRYKIDVSAAVVTFTHREVGTAFAITAGANATAALVTAASGGSTVPPGVFVCRDNSNAGQALLAAANAAANVWHITPASVNTGDTIAITITGDLDGDGERETYRRQTAAGASVQATVELIQPLLNAISGLTATEDNAKVVLTVDLAGVPIDIDIQVTGGNGTTCVAAEQTAVSGGLFAGPVAGVVVLEQRHELPAGGGLVSHSAGEELTVGRVGEYDVLLADGVTVNPGDPVYIVVSGSAQAGSARADGTNARLFKGARFLTANFTGMDGQNVAGVEVWEI